ncbi:MAG: two-component system cell cycle sensor histidine kinase/response regulator CckA [Planctomycetota bacterium]|jgi:two-component system cell cycle sensor histidine kinase/response regulator CckA
MLAYSGKGRFLVESLSLNSIIEEMARLLEVTISKTAILRVELAPKLPMVEAEGSQIRQVIMNLITNAAEAVGDRSGVVSIRTGAMECDRGYLDTVVQSHEIAEGTYVYVEVADTGCGMDAATLSKIFDPFFTTKFTGRGLGLAAVQGIIRGHSGAIRVYSEPNRGTTFKVLLPASSEPERTRPTPTDLPNWQGTGTILLVDDEETVRAIGSLMLKGLGFDVATAVDGATALKIYSQDPGSIACVILDLTMPHMNGDEVYRELRRIDDGVRVLLSSGYNEADIVQRFSGKGLAGFIQKPYGRDELAQALKGAIG